jgi:hypothetical protein
MGTIGCNTISKAVFLEVKNNLMHSFFLKTRFRNRNKMLTSAFLATLVIMKIEGDLESSQRTSNTAASMPHTRNFANL